MGQNHPKIVYYDGSEYSGDVNSKGQEHGNGRIDYMNGDKLTGTFENGNCLQGHLLYKNGNSYEGQLRDQKYHGNGFLRTPEFTMEGTFENGDLIKGKIIFLKNEDVYEGCLLNMKKHGKGVLKKHNQSIYTGQFKNDEFHGMGELVSKQSTYIGHFKNGKYDGKGELFLRDKAGSNKNQIQYKGQFVNGLFEGKGKIQYSNHDVYEGSFSKGVKSGYGFYRYANGDVYDGIFKKDKKNDENGKIVYKKTGITYKGGFVNGKYQGTGVLITPKWEYEGQFEDGYQHGKGKILYKSGEKFEGFFVKNKKEGKGTIEGKTRRTIAEYKQDIKNGFYKIISYDQKYEERGQYRNGLRDGKIFVRKEKDENTLFYNNGKLIVEPESDDESRKEENMKK